MTLDEPKDTDNVYDVDGIKILFDKEASRYSKDLEIDYKNSVFGKRFSVYQLYGAGSCH